MTPTPLDLVLDCIVTMAGRVCQTAAMIDFTCPRCGTDVTEGLYGPCAVCRAELRATQGSEGHELEARTYDPKMNVTPNAVALKE